MCETADLLWYVSYGSNLSWDRLRCYLSGGTPLGARRANGPARNPAPPRFDVAITLPGQVYFASHSAAWGGGVAFYDPDGSSVTLARAYLLTAEQFLDVMAQEQGRVPGTIPALPDLHVGDRTAVGAGRYGTLIVAGKRGGHPLVTFTASWAMADVALRAPSLSYLATLATGLAESHGLDVDAQARYLAALPGAAPPWEPAGLARALR